MMIISSDNMTSFNVETLITNICQCQVLLCTGKLPSIEVLLLPILLVNIIRDHPHVCVAKYCLSPISQDEAPIYDYAIYYLSLLFVGIVS